MNHGKRLLCGLAALLLCAGMLSGCGKKTQTESEAENAPASSAAEPETSAEDGPDPEQDAEAAAKNTAEAEEVLKGFLDGCLNHDLAAVDAAGDYRNLRAAISGKAFSDAEWQEEASGRLFDAFESYEIGAGSSRYQDLMDYDAGIRKFLNAEAENPDPADSDETLRCIAYLQDAYKRPEGYCEFPVTLKSGDGEQTDTLRLVKVEDKWQLELCESVVQQIAYNRARRDAFVGEANLTAEALYETVSDSLAEMSAQGIDITVLSGDYLFNRSGFRAGQSAADDPLRGGGSDGASPLYQARCTGGSGMCKFRDPHGERYLYRSRRGDILCGRQLLRDASFARRCPRIHDDREYQCGAGSCRRNGIIQIILKKGRIWL